MIRRNCTGVTLLMLCFLFIARLNAQTSTKGRDFWFGYMENLTLAFNGPPTFSVVIASDEFTSGTISLPKTGFEIQFNVVAGEAREIILPSAIYYQAGSDVVSNFGFHLVTDKPVSVTAFHYREFFTESSIVYPIEMLGSAYHVLTIADQTINKNPNSFIIVATANDTKIEITNKALTLSAKPSYKPYQVILQQGQTYQVQAAENLSGSTIKSLDGKKIAVFCGARQMFIFDYGCHNKTADSHIYEAILPDQYADTQFVFIPFALRGGDPISILKLDEDTKIYLNNKQITTPKYFLFDTTLFEPTAISTDKPVMIAHFNKSCYCGTTNSAKTGDPSLVYLISSKFGSNNEVFLIPTGFDSNYISIVSSSDSASLISLDGLNIKSYFTSISNSSGFTTTTISLKAGKHTLSSTSKFLANVYGFSPFDGYSHSLGFKTDLGDESEGLDIKVFPNPFIDQLTIRFIVPDKKPLNTTCEIYDEIGRKILVTQKTITRYDFDLNLNLESLAPAVYFIRLKYDYWNESSRVFKVIKAGGH